VFHKEQRQEKILESKWFVFSMKLKITRLPRWTFKRAGDHDETSVVGQKMNIWLTWFPFSSNYKKLFILKIAGFFLLVQLYIIGFKNFVTSHY